MTTIITVCNMVIIRSELAVYTYALYTAWVQLGQLVSENTSLGGALMSTAGRRTIPGFATALIEKSEA